MESQPPLGPLLPGHFYLALRLQASALSDKGAAPLVHTASRTQSLPIYFFGFGVPSRSLHSRK